MSSPLAVYRGADALQVRFNTLGLLVLIEFDDIMYANVIDVSTRTAVEERWRRNGARVSERGLSRMEQVYALRPHFGIDFAAFFGSGSRS